MPDQADLADERRDRDLIARAAAGDRAAFGALVARHRGAIHRLATILTRDAAAAEDVLQDTFVAALRGAAGFRGDGSVASWLFAIARHAAHRHGRRADQVPVAPESLDALGAAAGWGQPDVETVVAAAEERAALERALAELPVDERAVLVLRDVEGLSGHDTAAALELTLPAMKSRLHRARLRLAATLRRQGGDHVPRA
ncbi:MAG: RNA polymerase sigma factor [Kofleriaceae bacterium]|nr:RNA polymerase sigma factor [Kofleriaceae bacterium]MCL4223455.1 RNA polymerase sigma factor [Myxococcales bacterium]